jgi:hypothetical protein
MRAGVFGSRFDVDGTFEKCVECDQGKDMDKVGQGRQGVLFQSIRMVSAGRRGPVGRVAIIMTRYWLSSKQDLHLMAEKVCREAQ